MPQRTAPPSGRASKYFLRLPAVEPPRLIFQITAGRHSTSREKRIRLFLHRGWDALFSAQLLYSCTFSFLGAIMWPRYSTSSWHRRHFLDLRETPALLNAATISSRSSACSAAAYKKTMVSSRYKRQLLHMCHPRSL